MEQRAVIDLWIEQAVKACGIHGAVRWELAKEYSKVSGTLPRVEVPEVEVDGFLAPAPSVSLVLSVPTLNGGPAGIVGSCGSDLVRGVPVEWLSWGLFSPFLILLSHSLRRKASACVKGGGFVVFPSGEFASFLFFFLIRGRPTWFPKNRIRKKSMLLSSPPPWIDSYYVGARNSSGSLHSVLTFCGFLVL
ncbi:hypothetical protein KI387_031098 [Taxus chinensis]|uniref:Uncharacterized protein n=1 Tax=Taxus chinensis TaxID=29808 RepID=A0AA38CHK7_TAXCH|nr:hypothetical protein KI387_031098 [Taxus chinensis]